MKSKRFFIVLDLSGDTDIMANDKNSVANWIASAMSHDGGEISPVVYDSLSDLNADAKDKTGAFKWED